MAGENRLPPPNRIDIIEFMIGGRMKRVAVFVSITYALTLVVAGLFYVVYVRLQGNSDVSSGPLGILGMLYMWIPFLVSLFMIRHYGENFRDYGFNFRFNRWWLGAWLIPLLLILITPGISLLLDFGTLDLSGRAFLASMKGRLAPEDIRRMEQQLRDLGNWIYPLQFIQVLFFGSTVNTLFAFGEEMGWRGYLQKNLESLGFLPSSALIGLIWGIWHAPIILLGYNFPEQRLAGVAAMALSCIPLGILISYVRMKSRSVFGASIFHGMFNAVSGFSLVFIAGSSNLQKSAVGIAGGTAALLLVLVGLPLLRIFPPMRPGDSER